MFDLSLMITSFTQPKKAVELAGFELGSGLKFAFIAMLVLLVIKAVVALILALIEGTPLIGGIALTLQASIFELLIVLASILLMGFTAAFTAKALYQGTGDAGKTTGALSLITAPIFFFGILAQLVFILSSLLGPGTAVIFYWVLQIITLISALFTLFIAVNAIWKASNTTFLGAIVSTIIALIPALIASTILVWIAIIVIPGFSLAAGLV